MIKPILLLAPQTQRERETIIAKLRKKNYQLLSTNASLAHVNDRFPVNQWPFLAVDTEAGRIEVYRLPPSSYNIAINPDQIDALPKSSNMNESRPNIAQPKEEVRGVALPAPAQFSIKYKREDGKINKYTISNPISANNQTITCYCFGKGIRSFQKKRILSISQI